MPEEAIKNWIRISSYRGSATTLLSSPSLQHPGLVTSMESIHSISQQDYFFSALGPTDQGLTGQGHGALHVGESDKT